MSTVVLPTRLDVADYRLRVDLSGVEFVFDFRFNDRDGAWFFDLADALNAPIVQSVKVVLGMPLLRHVADIRRRPLGDLIAIDLTDSGVEAGLTDLGSRVLLTYADDVT